MQNPFEQLRSLQPGPEHLFDHVGSLILHETIPDARRVRVYQGDEGVDTFTGTWGETGELDVYQIKYFVGKWGDSQKQQIRDSYARAKQNANYNLGTWYLVVPTNLTAQDYKWFDTWRKEQPHPIEIIDGADLTERLELPQCGPARQLLKGWGALGLPGGAFLVPSISIFATDRFAVLLRLRLENKGDKTGRAIRLKVQHTETSTVAYGHDEQWWKDTGGGGLNPRQLEAIKDIHPGDNAPIMSIPFRDMPEGDVVIQVKITAEDMTSSETTCSLSHSDIESGRTRPFAAHAQGAKEGADTSDEKKNVVLPSSPQFSQAAKEILDLCTEDIINPALHVITRPFPSDPTLTGFFVGSTSKGGGGVYGMKTKLLNAAIHELIETGHLDSPPVETTGRLIYEFIR